MFLKKFPFYDIIFTMKNRVETILSGIGRTQKVANAYLFLGGDPKNKMDSALAFARALNCESENNPCNACSSCKKAQKGVHPDIIVIEKDKASLKIDQIRQLKGFTRYGPAEGRCKVVIVNDADTLTQDASNSFLKALEEPPPNVSFILISNREEGILPTIASRCQKILFKESEISPPSEEINQAFEALKNRPSDFINNSDLLLRFDNAENLLGELFTLFAQARIAGSARTIFSALKNIKKSANKKLALDWMCLKLWKEN